MGTQGQAGMARTRFDEANHFVYFIRAPSVGLIKIGFSSDSPEHRLGNLRVASPIPLERLGLIAGSRHLEQLLHIKFAALHSHLEWFHARDELHAFIREHAAPWSGPVPPFVKQAGIPMRCREWEIVRDDPWFREMLRNSARLSILAPMTVEGKIAARRLALLRKIPSLARKGNSDVEYFSGKAKEKAVIVFVGGRDDRTELAVERWMFGVYLREGIMGSGRKYSYTLGRPVVVDDLVSDRIEMFYRGRIPDRTVPIS